MIRAHRVRHRWAALAMLVLGPGILAVGLSVRPTPPAGMSWPDSLTPPALELQPVTLGATGFDLGVGEDTSGRVIGLRPRLPPAPSVRDHRAALGPDVLVYVSNAAPASLADLGDGYVLGALRGDRLHLFRVPEDATGAIVISLASPALDTVFGSVDLTLPVRGGDVP